MRNGEVISVRVRYTNFRHNIEKLLRRFAYTKAVFFSVLRRKILKTFTVRQFGRKSSTAPIVFINSRLFRFFPRRRKRREIITNTLADKSNKFFFRRVVEFFPVRLPFIINERIHLRGRMKLFRCGIRPLFMVYYYFLDLSITERFFESNLS